MASSGLAPIYQRGIDENILRTVAEYDPVYRLFMHVEDTSSRYIWHQGWSGYGLPMTPRYPGTPVESGQFAASFSKQYIVQGWGLGDQIPYEDEEDDLYGVIHRALAMKSGFMGVAFRTAIEYYVAQFFGIEGFASGAVSTMPDNVSLFNTAHPVSSSQLGVTYANRPSTDVDFSVTSYQACATNLRTQLRPDNLTYINDRPRYGIFNPAWQYIVPQVLRAPMYPNTADFNYNFNSEDNVTPIYWPYWAYGGATGGATGGNNSWFFVGHEHHLHFFWRQPPRSFVYWDQNVLAQQINVTMRTAIGASDWRSCYGSRGM